MPTDQPQQQTHNRQDLADLIRRCAQNNTPLIDYGLAHQGVGHPPPTNHIKLVQTPADPEHYTKDMAITAPAGATFGQVQQILQQADQFLPIDADDDLSIGEIITHNVYGPLRVSYGSARDLILGIGVIDGQAKDIRTGGRTIKNVAGYDLARFMVGSLGQFGCIYEATLRTYALPTQVLVVSIDLKDPATFDTLATDLLVSDARPAQALLTRNDSAWTIRLAYHGRYAGCAAQVRSLETQLDQITDAHITASGPCTFTIDNQERTAARYWLRTAQTVLKVIVPPAATGTTCNDVIQHLDDDHRLHVYALPIHGCIYLGGDLDAPTADQLASHAAQLAASHHGHTVWYRRPQHLHHLPPFSPTRPDLNLLKRLKATLDPAHILNPGRLIPQEQPTP